MKTYQQIKREGKWIIGISLFLFALFTFMGLQSTLPFLFTVLLIVFGLGRWCVGKAEEIDHKVEHNNE